ncbi:Mannose-6-phosphate isomerase [Dissophora globulifera]|uniref:Mannose-6-phosphate isomerase n=1 Tax=Dissophora globulifera TaxID=979702 RepID=A0A9P6UVD6_9FUNG|nr:Mannose-6-phosphate isomerase [Dissophora globulifera]
MATRQPAIFRLDCKAQSYDWGKIGQSSAVAKFALASPGFQFDEKRPYAELWMGTHPSGPSTVYQSDTTLESVLKANPQLLTPFFYEKYHGHLPFLFKVLSIQKALSIQAHPDKTLAERLFKERPDVYKDDNHKPEMAIALTDFEALCGFRPLEEISAFLDQWPELRALVGDSEANDFQDVVAQSKSMEGIKGIKEGRRALKTLYTSVMKADASNVKQQLVQLIHRLKSNSTEYPVPSMEELVLRIYSQFPDDVGVFSLFFLNYIMLEPGQAIFLAANEPHAYLSGDLMECMAASDNVVRAGLTPKFKDVEVLTQMLTYQTKSRTEQLLSGVLCTPTGHSLMYDPPIEEFSVILTKLGHDKEKERLRGAEGPSIVIVTKGKGAIHTEKHSETDADATVIQADVGNVFFVGANTPFTIEALSEEGVTIFTAFSVRPDKKDHFHH